MTRHAQRAAPRAAPHTHAGAARRLGNLFLSSCPGKKGARCVSAVPHAPLTSRAAVRLSGPVHGRGGVCRDLRQDLKRIKQLGAGCVVWCVSPQGSVCARLLTRPIAQLPRR